MRLLRATVQILRLDMSLLAFLSIFVPVLVRTNDLRESVRKAAPLLFIGMCTFIINDLDDIEKDRTNHPSRPLPSGQIQPVFVAVLYFMCLAGALLTTLFCITGEYVVFLYYLVLTLCISYSYVVEYLPAFKALYVAGASAIPVLIVIAYYPNETTLYLVAAANFSFMLGHSRPN